MHTPQQVMPGDWILLPATPITLRGLHADFGCRQAAKAASRECYKEVQQQVSKTRQSSQCNISPSNTAHLLATVSISALIRCSPGPAELQEQALSTFGLSNKGAGLRFPRTQVQLQIGCVPDGPAQVLLPTKGC